MSVQYWRTKLEEACVGCFASQISGWNDSEGEPRALVFAQEHGAGLEAWQTRTRRGDSDSVNPGSNPGRSAMHLPDMTPYFQFPLSLEKSLFFRVLAPRRRIGDKQRRQTSRCGARTAAGSLEAVFDPSHVEHCVGSGRRQAGPNPRSRRCSCQSYGRFLESMTSSDRLGGSYRTSVQREDLFVADAIIMDHVASSSVRFAAPTCPGVDVAWDGFRELGIWTKPGSRFLCIEPWLGTASPADFDGPFVSKPGVVLIPPGETRLGHDAHHNQIGDCLKLGGSGNGIVIFARHRRFSGRFGSATGTPKTLKNRHPS
jgi:hypothetical protein